MRHHSARRAESGWGVTALAAALALVLASSADATVISQAWYRCGEDDPGAGAGNVGNATTVDHMGTLDLSRDGTPTYRADAPPSQYTPLGGSVLSLDFDGSETYESSVAVTSAPDNLGIEVWAKAQSAGHLNTPFHMGNGGNGLAIEINNYGGDFRWTGVVGGIFRLDSGLSVELDDWTHLALVRDGGTARLFVDGILRATRTTGYNLPTGTLIGAFQTNNSRSFNGLVDEARVFAFDEGGFVVTDLNYAPEPTTLSLLALGGLALLRRRRRTR